MLNAILWALVFPWGVFVVLATLVMMEVTTWDVLLMAATMPLVWAGRIGGYDDRKQM